ncbi:MAG: vitamin K epoxide reductase family protein [Acidobacteriota bacterium]|nr:vitamin K epoxide reductase family protein [Acidobacteriota bacterium]
MALIALYQTGIIPHLPEPSLPKLDADRVDASPEAYEKFATPDAILGLGSYVATMGLAAMGGADRAKEQPWIPLALSAKMLFDVGQAVRLSVDQATKQKAFCFWCLLAAAATFASAPLIVPEAIEAARAMAGKR